MSDVFRRKPLPRSLGLLLACALTGVTAAAGPVDAVEPVPRADDAAAKSFAKGHALVVAINHYENVNGLPQAVFNDGQRMYSLLTSPDFCGYPPDNVKFLANGKATLENIRNELKGLAQKTNADDTVVVFFSGHGGRSGPKGAERSFLLPVEFDPNQEVATSLGSVEFTKLLGAIKAERLVVLLDACHAAATGDVKAVDPTEGIKAGLSNAAYDVLGQGSGRAILASCQEGELSIVMPGAKNSLFTEKLLEAFNGDAGSPGDGTIRVLDVFRYVSLMVPKFNKNQHPVLRTRLETDFAVALYRGGQAKVVDVPDRPKPPPDAPLLKLPGPNKVELAKHLVTRWPNLAAYLDIPLDDVSTFPKGQEPLAILNWLDQRDELNRLPGAFKALGYLDLLKYLPGGGAGGPGGPDGPVGPDIPGGALKFYVPKTPGDQKRVAMMKQVSEEIEHLAPDTSPQDVIQRIQGVLDRLGQGGLGPLLGGDASESKYMLRCYVADAMILVCVASNSLFKYREELACVKDQFDLLKPVYAADPRWEPKEPPEQVLVSPEYESPVCLRVFHNRLNYVIAVHASTESRVDDATRDEARSAVKVAVEALRNLSAPKGMRGQLWLFVCVAYYLNADFDLAREALRQATIDFGTIPPLSHLNQQDRLFLSNHHLLLGAIQAEQGDTDEALRTVAAAEKYATGLVDDRGVAGYDYLLVARASKTPEGVAVAIEKAVEKLDNAHADNSCRYNLACALAKKAESAPAAEKAEYLRRATDLFREVVSSLKTNPVEPEIEAIRKDPFLKDVVSRPAVKKALDDFNWDPPSLIPHIPINALWHSGVPLKRYRFTRLNRDDRG